MQILHMITADSINHGKMNIPGLCGGINGVKL